MARTLEIAHGGGTRTLQVIGGNLPDLKTEDSDRAAAQPSTQDSAVVSFRSAG
jgi:hypothetical protein